MSAAASTNTPPTLSQEKMEALARLPEAAQAELLKQAMRLRGGGCGGSKEGGGGEAAPDEQAVDEATAEQEVRAALAADATATPPPPVGQFPETWDNGATFHWSGAKDKANDKIDVGSSRHAAEEQIMKAIVRLDKARLKAHRKPKCMASYRAVSVRWLKAFASTLDRTWTTAMVVESVIKPATAATRGRYVEQMAAGDVGEAILFASHTWGAPFVDLVAAIAHVATDDMFVWVDIFAV